MTWKTEDSEDAEKARTVFQRLTREGWLALVCSKREGESTRVLEFKPEYGELQFIPLSEGG